jgi:hypothetical protein
MKISSFAALLGMASLIALPADAHHSFAMFEPEKTVTLDATVKSVEWSNPHIWINLVAPDPSGGPPVGWGVEAGATGTMMRFGWKRNTLKPGDKVVATIHPMRDGTKAGSLVKFVTASGDTLVIGVQGARVQ